ncbi:MAG: transcription-repair coupling factor [Chitinispirillales bacterium]|jgi:transcription-repair coupling factor (superfamily II helicase)|nr:transcription-repair coupling factor [Chitinispirillales bacterium]
MKIAKLSDIFTSLEFPGLSKYCETSPQNALFRGITGSGGAFLAADLYRQAATSIFVVVENAKRAEQIVNDCRAILGDDEAVALFPSRDAVPYNMKSPFGPTTEARFGVLKDLLDGQRRLIVAPAAVLLQRIAPGRELFNSVIHLETDSEAPIEKLAAWLTEYGFRRENQTTDIGEFSIRGGIMDVYPFLSENPYRIEFWGDTIESIRAFDVFTQKSVGNHKAVDILPMREFCFSDEKIEAAVEKMLDCRDKSAEINKSAIHRLEHQWNSVCDLEGIEWFLHWFDIKTASVLDYLPNDAIIVFDDIVPIERRLSEARANYEHHIDRVPELFASLVSPPDKLLLDDALIMEELSCYNNVFIDTVDIPQNTAIFTSSFAPLPPLQKEIDTIVKDIRERTEEGYRCIIACSSAGHAERMAELLGENQQYVEICTSTLHSGFVSNDNRLLVYTESQLLNRPYHRPIKTRKQKSGVPLTAFDQLAPGDTIVHVDHGIGRFIGVERVKAGDTVSDCMVIIYADNAKVYIPVEDFHKVQKYIGKEGIAPALSKLGTSTWDKLKQRTRESLREMAQELIDLYAKRQYLEGISCAPDNTWQKEFEETFIYDETPDQLQAIKDVKADMESNRPMDRLICGDVGFGKTEVAMRAAFKAVMSGYQVAILAPTTILAAQHFSTFSERMANFPVRIESMSRFRTGKEQKATLERLVNGQVDILIGTHRILSEDIKFKNLGLLVIDEEQRFGVKHKEALKHLRYRVDVLSMTATPIPRTLHMSLIGARDLSIINTPPRNRLPIETRIAEYHDELVKNAIENELERGGQVYFVNNRIKNIPALQERLEQLAPKAKTISAHGQMDESELEAVMKEFIAGRYDILLSTVIIENGLDIPNVNTIIVNRADTLGLSQLYQLRGRVGRSSEQAYAFFLTLPFAQIKEDSLKRLKAMEQYTELGSGFQIAMRDLEIRGAGNILGTRQHGFIAAVGFELYCRLLQEAVDEIRGDGESKPALPETRLEIPLQAYIPTEYIADGPTRISIYQEMSSLKTTAELLEMERGLSDRFGAMPECVKALTLLMRLKILGRVTGCSKIVINKDGTLDLFIDGNENQPGNINRNKTENQSDDDDDSDDDEKKQDIVKKRIKRFFDSSENYQFEILYGEQVRLRTELTPESVMQMAIETARLLESASQEEES